MNEKLKTRIGILSQLANIDGNFDVRELAFIYNVCLRNGVAVDSVAGIIAKPDNAVVLHDLTLKEREEYLKDILLLMMIDGKILPKEIQFCQEMGVRLGFNLNGLTELISELKYKNTITEDLLTSKIEHLPKDNS